jgi:hypothetical protein
MSYALILFLGVILGVIAGAIIWRKNPHEADLVSKAVNDAIDEVTKK